MKTLIKLILILSLSNLSLTQFITDCKCDIGYYMDQNLKQCRKNPTSSHPKYQANCKDYIFNSLDNLPICLRCNPDSYLLTDQNNKCIKHTFENCLQVSKSAYNPSQYECLECPSGTYANITLQKCVANPTTGQQGYIEHCEKYQFYIGESAPECARCTPGKYLHHINKTCLQPSNINNCYRYKSDNECQDCNSGYNTSISKLQCLLSNPTLEGDRLDGCISYSNTGSGYTCTSCNSHYYRSSGRCTAVNTVINNCSVYSSLDACHICKSPTHYTAVGNKSCEECPARTSNLDAAGSEPTNPGKVPNPSHGFILSNSMFIFILIISAVQL